MTKLTVTRLHATVLTCTLVGPALWLLEHAEGASLYLTSLCDVVELVGDYGPSYVVQID